MTSYAQSISLSAGWNKNELDDNGYHYRLTELGLKENDGWSLNLNFHPTSSKQSLSIIIDNYKGEVIPEYHYKDVPDLITFKKTTLGLGLYPFDIRLFGGLYIQPGAEISVLLSNETKFVETSGEVNHYYDDSLHIVNDLQCGISVIARYQINIGNFFIAPSYKVYLGSLSEFGENADLIYGRFGNVFSFRQTFSFGVGLRFTYKNDRSVP